MKLHTLAQKIGLGYLLMVLVLAVAVITTIGEIRQLSTETERLVEVREPTARAGQDLESGINRALAALRGWIVATDDHYRQNRRQIWSDEVEVSLQALDKLAPGWAAENVVRLNELKPLLDALELRQRRAEELAEVSREEANTFVENEVIPLVSRVREVLTAMLENQRTRFRQDLNTVSEDIDFLRRLEWALLGLGVIISGVLSLVITRSVTRPVAEAVLVADNIASGDLDTRVDVKGSRELETLGAALLNMRDTLKEKTRQTERYNWLSTGQIRLGEAMRGDKTVELLASSMVSFFANYIDACIGSFYLLDDNRQALLMLGSYAHGGGTAANSFNIGEGLVGQVARSGRAMVLNDVDEHYIRIRSSIVDGPPRSLYLSPVFFEGDCLGVLEFGKLTPFADVEMEFIQSNMEAVGISLNSAIARRKIQALLEETQQQSEELQQQQEELEQTNEELEEQAQQLKEQQEELQSANEELEEQTQMILQKNQDLEAARENIEIKARQLEISSKYKSEFLANMSHELRTPLNSLLILAQDLANNSRGNLDEEQVESAQVVCKSGHDLLHLINDILDLSKVEAGKLDLNVSDVRLWELAEDIRRNFKRTAREKGLIFEVGIGTQVPERIATDRHRLLQVLNNLISNALKFTDQGEVRVDFQVEPQAESEDWLSITVSDTGIGIPKDKQEMIFEAFIQAEGGTARKYGGTGLGLSICRELVGLLGGSLKVESEPGKGASFRLLLPLQAPERMTESAGQPARPIPQRVESNLEQAQLLQYPSIADQRHNLREQDRVLLIIEDDNNFAGILAAQAVAKGFKHINAATGEDGMRLAAEYRPDAIILDLALPGMDGHSVLRELKSQPDLRHIPVHIISAQEKNLDPIRSGALDYLTKPVSKEQLEQAFTRIENFIDRKMKNLLIVEDDDTLRKAIVKLIGNGDVRCLEASTAKQALAVCQQQPVDCMVLDVGLPDMSGFELLKRLEREYPGKVPPVIVYTGRELTRQENNELQQYAETIIVKGVKSEERLLDETALFLHRTVKTLPEAKQNVITHLYESDTLLQGKRVLLVDDDMRNIFALSKVLREKGMDIIKAENGQAALDALDANPEVDFVLMDIMMPEMDGYECMRKIRERGAFRQLPIVALTAKAMKDDRQKCIDAGANDYISKPVDVGRLISLMRIWISQ